MVDFRLNKNMNSKLTIAVIALSSNELKFRVLEKSYENCNDDHTDLAIWQRTNWNGSNGVSLNKHHDSAFKREEKMILRIVNYIKWGKMEYYGAMKTLREL